MTTTSKVIVSIIVLAAAAAGIYYFVITRPVPVSDETAQARITETVSETQAPSAARKLAVVPAESSASFTLNEELRGTPTKVVGTTSDVAGTVTISQDPASFAIGEILINAQTFKTDSDQRNGAIARMILESTKEENKFISFKATNVAGLPLTLTPGAEFPFTVSGNLTIKGVTKPVIWNATGTWGADGSLAGSATTTVTYGDYGVKVPDLPFLANVEKDAVLTFSFVAR